MKVLAIVVLVIAVVVGYVFVTYSALPPITDPFPPNIRQLNNQNKHKTFNRFSTTTEVDIKLFEVFQPTRTSLESSKNATIVIVHGWGEHLLRYDHLADFLNQKGYNVYRYDSRGSGHSSGRKAYFALDEVHDDLEQVLTERLPNYVLPLIREDSKHKIFVLAHSMGGYVASTYEMYRGGVASLFEKKAPSQFVFAGHILSAPAVGIGDDVKASPIFPLSKVIAPILAATLPSLPVQPALDVQYVTRNDEIRKAYLQDPMVYKGPFLAAFSGEVLKVVTDIEDNKLQKRITAPILVLVGTKDKTVSPEACITLYELASSKDKTLKKYEGFYHEVLNEPEREQVYADVLKWLNQRS